MSVLFGLILTSILAMPYSARGQYTPESTPRAGESRANKHQYLSSHNAYQDASVPPAAALDAYNVWEIELDVTWDDENVSSGEFWVLHNCFDLGGEGPLSDYLAEIVNTYRANEGFFFLNLEITLDSFCVLGWSGSQAAFLNALQQTLIDAFPPGSIYTSSDFKNSLPDDRRWPSIQELLRRGKHVAISSNLSRDFENFFIGRPTDEDPPYFSGGLSNHDAILNTDDYDALLPNHGDRFLSRWYPSASCVSESFPPDRWGDALANGFNFVGTNCIGDRVNSNYADLHPPLPTYIVPTSSFPLPQLGTKGLPYVGLGGAFLGLSRINYYNDITIDQNVTGGVQSYSHPTLIEVRMEGGTYDASGVGGVVIDAPVVLVGDGVVLIN